MGQEQVLADRLQSDIKSNPTVNDVVQTKSRAPEIIFLLGVAGVSLLGGFGLTLAMTKKKDPNMFIKGLGVTEAKSGSSLAMRALAYGTAAATAGVGVISFAIFALSGAQNMKEFRTKMRTILPSIPKNQVQGKSDFKTVQELVNYITDSDKTNTKNS